MDGVSRVSFNCLHTLYGYTQNMYICTYIHNKKLSSTLICISKFDVKLGVGEHHFRYYPMYVSNQIFGFESHFFSFCFSLHPFICFKILKVFFPMQNFKKLGSKLVTFLFF